MKKKLFLVSLMAGIFMSGHVAQAQQTITFEAGDGVEITADLYQKHDKNAPFVLLFHQAGWSRGEYREIAPKLNEMGFNCMAIDQRSGGSVNGIDNSTKKSASAKNLKTGYLDALPDMYDALSYAKRELAAGKVIIWGSSYSASLVLKMAGDHPEKMDGVLAFAPGEYFARFGKGRDFIAKSAKNITKPVFITSAKHEKDNWFSIYEAIPSPKKAYYLPSTKGNHGSRALWKKFSDSKGYWQQVRAFLEQFQSR